MDFVAPPGLDPTHDVLQYGRQALDAIFAPKSVAVIGATETAGSVGRTVVWNLMSSTFGGTIYPVNPKRNSILGIKAYPSLSAVPEVVDLIVHGIEFLDLHGHAIPLRLITRKLPLLKSEDCDQNHH